VVAFYSTPSHYTDAKNAATKKAGVDWEVRGDDIFPLGDNPHAYWSGYFTSRPGLKRQVRFASNFLSAARQMEVISGTTAAEVDHPTTRPSPPVVRNNMSLFLLNFHFLERSFLGQLSCLPRQARDRHQDG